MTVAWTKLPPLPGFVLIDEDGPAVVAAWKERYIDHAEDIDEGLAECFPINKEEKDGSSSNG